ncbi:MAG: anthranilate synthase component I [Bacteroidota bacterium]
MDFKEFQKFAESYNVIPVAKTLLADMLTPVSAYLHLRRETGSSFLFESIEGNERIARFSFIGRDPVLLLKCKVKITTITENGASTEVEENFFDLIDNTLKRFTYPSLPDLPRFTGGLVGYIGYDAIRFIEDIPDTVENNLSFPDSMLGVFTTIVVFDHFKHQLTIIHNAVIKKDLDLRMQFDHALSDIDRIENLLTKFNGAPPKFVSEYRSLNSEMTKNQYQDIVQKAKDYICSGDIFQVVLSQRFSTNYRGDLFNVYRSLRVLNPSPYLFYLDFEGNKIIGSSPEVLIRIENQTAELYPIAGTRPRGKNDSDDLRMEQELLADEKERAEHIMLVDLGRNDLGRICDAGSVTVDQFMFIVKYSHVMHIASRITGKVLNSKSCVDVFKSTFPAGTVSGAPKIRAMEIIDKLEISRRGIYAGGVGYFGFSGNMDFCITIRSLFASENRIYFQAGAGIVADSEPDNEYFETINKSKALIEALRTAEGIIF